MAGRKRSGRAAAEAAFADLMKEQSRLVGDVGASHEAMLTKWAEAVAEVERYEAARTAATKAGAVTERQLDAMGYKKAPKLPALNVAGARATSRGAKSGEHPGEQSAEDGSGTEAEPSLDALSGGESDNADGARELAAAGAGTGSLEGR